MAGGRLVGSQQPFAVHQRAARQQVGRAQRLRDGQAARQVGLCLLRRRFVDGQRGQG